MPISCAHLLDPLIKADDAAGAEAQLLIYAPQLSAEARAEAGTARRVRLLCAWARHGRAARCRYLASGRNRRMGEPGGVGFRPRLVAARRLERRVDRLSAGRPARAATRASRRRLLLGRACRTGRGPAALGRAAAQGRGNTAESTESFYGLLARETLGLPTKLGSDPFIGFDPPVDQLPNVQRAIELARIGEAGAGRGNASPPGQDRRVRPSITPSSRSPRGSTSPRRSCGSPTTANGAPAPTPPTAIPIRAWRPLNGWRVDPALAFGHIVQESAFRRTAVSHGRRRRADAGPADHRPANGDQPRRSILARQPDRSAVSTSSSGKASSRRCAALRRPPASCRA